MPTIECWHVARWIALFESQITRLPSFHFVLRPSSFGSSQLPFPTALFLHRDGSPPPFLAPPLFRGASPPSLREYGPKPRKREREERKAHSNWQYRQFATCLRSLPLLSPLRRGVRVNDSRIRRETRTRSR